MWSCIEYNVDVGSFRSPDNGLLAFDEHNMRLPLVQNMLIGRADSLEEQGYCDGGRVLDLVKNEHFCGGSLSYRERPSYNGQKIILPNDPHGFSTWISREHGKLVRSEQDGSFYYQHRSQSSKRTFLWTPEKGIESAVDQYGQLLNLGLSDKRPDAHLLLGGLDEDEAMGECRELGRAYTGAVQDFFPFWSYYVHVRRRGPGSQ